MGRTILAALLVAVALTAAADAGAQTSAADRLSPESPALSANRADNARIARVVEALNADVGADPSFGSVVAELVGLEYRTPGQEIEWAVDRMQGGSVTPSLTWGDVAVLSYFRASTGWSFSELVDANAHQDFSGFVDTMEMRRDIMAASLAQLADRATRERNTRIFDRIRSVRYTDALPDLGAGFGLFQESLDFRNLDPPGPTKVHDGIVLPGGTP